MGYSVSIENVGGIYQGHATITDGLNAIRASNWQGKSSLISAIKAVMGSGKPLTEGRERGSVELDTGSDTYRVEFRRENGNVVRRGSPYVTDELTLASAELFMFFDEHNSIRRAVRAGENLEKYFTRPLDIEDIESRITERKRERERVEQELSDARKAAEEIPSVREKERQLETELDNLRAQQANIQTGQPESTELQRKRDELGELRAEKSRLKERVEQLTRSIERFETEIEDKRAQREEIEVPDTEDVADAVESRQSELNNLERDVELLQAVSSANKRIIDEERFDLLTDVEHGLVDDTVACWICGTEIDRTNIESVIERQEEKISELQSDADKRRERVEELQSKLDRRQEKARKTERLEREVEDLQEEAANRRQSLSSARERLDSLESDIADLSAEVDDLDEQVTYIESDIKVAERELESTREELDELNARANQRAVLEDEYDRLTDEIKELRNRRNRIKRELRENFDETVTEIVDMFETGFDGAYLTGQFDLVVARNGQEASLETLSEGERELLGVIVALAGCEVFDVADDIPIMLLDEFSGFDEETLSTLIEYLIDRTESLVFTAFPEQDSFDTNVVELSDWDLVSEKPASA